MTPLILQRGSISRPSGQWRDDDYDVLENGVVVGRIFHLDAAAPEGRPWMWASGHGGHHIERAAHGYEATREAAMAAFAKSMTTARLVIVVTWALVNVRAEFSGCGGLKDRGPN